MAQGKRVKKRKSNAGRNAAIGFTAVIAVALLAVAGMGAYVAGRDTIFPNVTVAGVEIGGMSYDEALDALNAASVTVPSGVEATARLTSTVSVTVTSDEAGLTGSITEAVDTAYAYGRGGNFFTNLASYIKCLSGKHEIYSEKVFDEETVRSRIADAAQRANHEGTEAAYEVVGEELLLTRGSASYTVDEDGVFDFIRETLISGVSATTGDFAEVSGSSADPDFDAIYNEVHTDPVDARYDPDTKTVVAGTPGVDFDLAEAKRLYEAAAPGETVRVPLTVTQPQVGGVDEVLFKDKLAEKNTSLSGSSSNRINNVTLAAQAVNGTVLNPGDEFSFNGVVGQRTKAKGYKEAGAYSGGQTVNEVGGGICQVSSTIYFCTLKADLEITKRTNHSFSVSYLPASLDATVSWKEPDFKFKNNKSFPIKITAWVEGKKLYVELWGTKENDNYVELESKTLSYIENKTIEKIDPTLVPGEKKVEVAGHGGHVSEAYKLVYDGTGKLLSRTRISKDTYKAQDRVVLVGPEPSEPAGPAPTEPQPTETQPTTPPETEPTNPPETDPPATEPEATTPPETEPSGGDEEMGDPGEGESSGSEG